MFKDIERGPGQLSAFQRRHQRRLVHDAAARAVDETRRRLEQRQSFGVYQPARPLRQRRVYRDEIGRAQQLLQRHHPDSFSRGSLRRDKGVKYDHIHLQPDRTTRHRRADLAKADDAKRLAAQLDACEMFLVPAPRMQCRVRVADMAG